MKRIDCEQYSPEWVTARLGIPTASEFSKIITSTGAASTQMGSYRDGLLAEWLSGQPASFDRPTEWMLRGKELEAEARGMYEFAHDVEVSLIGFVTNDAGTAGASPDGGFAGSQNALLEIKCPSPAVHVAYLCGQKVPTGYRAQTQGQMWICEAEWLDFVSYHPAMPMLTVREYRDDVFIQQLAARVAKLNEMVDEKREQLIALGYEPAENANERRSLAL